MGWGRERERENINNPSICSRPKWSEARNFLQYTTWVQVPKHLANPQLLSQAYLQGAGTWTSDQMGWRYSRHQLQWLSHLASQASLSYLQQLLFQSTQVLTYSYLTCAMKWPKPLITFLYQLHSFYLEPVLITHKISLNY